MQNYKVALLPGRLHRRHGPLLLAAMPGYLRTACCRLTRAAISIFFYGKPGVDLLVTTVRRTGRIRTICTYVRTRPGSFYGDQFVSFCNVLSKLRVGEKSGSEPYHQWASPKPLCSISAGFCTVHDDAVNEINPGFNALLVFLANWEAIERSALGRILTAGQLADVQELERLFALPSDPEILP
jgi:hypothetical protein